MNEVLKVFENDRFGEIRTIEENGKILFVGSDVAKALGYAKARNAVTTHCKGALKRGILTKGGLQEMTVITEGDLYRLIVNSKLQSAEKFEAWVFDEILPQIRKTGSYNMPALPQTYAEALRLAADQAEQIEAQKLQLTEAKPKVEFFDAVAGSKDAIEISSVAKVLGIAGMGRNNLFAFLRDKKILMSNNQPYQKYVDGGYFRVLEQKYEKPNGDTCINIKTLVFQKGVAYIKKLINDAENI